MDPGSIIEHLFWFVKRGKKGPEQSNGSGNKSAARTKKRGWNMSLDSRTSGC
jgi:hypothetical protein